MAPGNPYAHRAIGGIRLLTFPRMLLAIVARQRAGELRERVVEAG